MLSTISQFCTSTFSGYTSARIDESSALTKSEAEAQVVDNVNPTGFSDWDAHLFNFFNASFGKGLSSLTSSSSLYY